MEIKFTKKFIKAFSKWLKKNGFATECEYVKGGELSWQPDEDIIYIPDRYNNDPDSLFMRHLRGLSLTSDFDVITVSLLHEIGHAQTQHLFTTRESNKCDVIKAMYAITIDEDSDDFYIKYWEVPDENMANKWAINYADTFPKKVEKLENIVEEYVKFG